MNQFTVNGALLRDMYLAASAVLEHNKASIDALNVFPVPDGDTGTNMSMTMKGAAKAVAECKDDTVTAITDALANGALRSARGNSGVILSQIFRGFSRALKGEELLTSKLLVKAFVMGKESAYKAVMRPKEGTMLTVISRISDALVKAQNGNKTLPDMLDVILTSGEAALKETPELLPVLKEAGVVDSGGMGLLAVFRGFKMAFDGDDSFEVSIESAPTGAAEAEPDDMLDGATDIPDTSEIKYAYCNEFFIINLFKAPTDEDVEKLREKLIKIGDSVVVAYDDGFIKVHVHSSYPGKVLQLALCLGELDKVKIENMLEQNRAMHKKIKDSEKEYAIVAVGAGDGIESMFTDLGAAAVVSGGQTMNPSIETLAKAIRKVNARNVFVFPNNSNIILAAQQAAAITSERNVIVIPTTTIMQGLTAVTAFNSDLDVAANEKRMRSAAADVISGAVTYAVRSTSFEGKHIDEGDILGMINNKIVLVGKEVEQVSADLIAKMAELLEHDEPIVTVLYGADTTEESANALVAKLENAHADAEFIVQRGGQHLYYYYFSVE